VKFISAEEATHVERPARGPWVWPRLVETMISDSFRVTGCVGLNAANGDPLSHAFAVNMLETLYRLGYAVVKLDAEDAGRPPSEAASR
jgi:hypothetical protein